MIETWALFLEALPGYALKLGAALICGALLGLEREWKDKPAGLRTILLITLGSALFMMVSEIIPLRTSGPETITRVDPSRIAAGVVSGIGFLGAGSIIQSRGAVHGLTTAAVIWSAAAIGLCAGTGRIMLGLAFTTLTLGVLIVMDPFSDWLSRFGRQMELDFIAPDDSLVLTQIEVMLRKHGVTTDQIGMQPHGEGAVRVRVTYRTGGGAAHRLLGSLTQVEGLRGVRRYDETR